MQYVLQSGDVPWTLATKYAGNGARWPELCKANPSLASHPTYGCVFPKVGSTINLPDTWPNLPRPASGGSVTSVSTTITAPIPAATQQSLQNLGIQAPSELTLYLDQATVQQAISPSGQASAAAAAAAKPSTTNSSGTAPAAQNAVIPGAQTTNASILPKGYNPEYMKVGLLAVGILALGVLAYKNLTSKEGAGMKRNPGRRRARKAKAKRPARRVKRVAAPKKRSLARKKALKPKARRGRTKGKR